MDAVRKRKRQAELDTIEHMADCMINFSAVSLAQDLAQTSETSSSIAQQLLRNASATNATTLQHPNTPMDVASTPTAQVQSAFETATAVADELHHIVLQNRMGHQVTQVNEVDNVTTTTYVTAWHYSGDPCTCIAADAAAEEEVKPRKITKKAPPKPSRKISSVFEPDITSFDEAVVGTPVRSLSRPSTTGTLRVSRTVHKAPCDATVTLAQSAIRSIQDYVASTDLAGTLMVQRKVGTPREGPIPHRTMGSNTGTVGRPNTAAALPGHAIRLPTVRRERSLGSLGPGVL